MIRRATLRRPAMLRRLASAGGSPRPGTLNQP